MKMQWERYQELELIPGSVPYPKPSLLARLTAPVRRSFANAFAKDLSQRHQILFLKRCLVKADFEQDKPAQRDREPLATQALTQQQQQAAQAWLSRGGLPWWTWYDS